MYWSQRVWSDVVGDMAMSRQVCEDPLVGLYCTSTLRMFEETGMPLSWYVLVLSLRRNTRSVVT